VIGSSFPVHDGRRVPRSLPLDCPPKSWIFPPEEAMRQRGRGMIRPCPPPPPSIVSSFFCQHFLTQFNRTEEVLYPKRCAMKLPPTNNFLVPPTPFTPHSPRDVSASTAARRKRDQEISPSSNVFPFGFLFLLAFCSFQVAVRLPRKCANVKFTCPPPSVRLSWVS